MLFYFLYSLWLFLLLFLLSYVLSLLPLPSYLYISIYDIRLQDEWRHMVHSNAHKVIAGFFLSPEPEVT
jgi:hypothetical protein